MLSAEERQAAARAIGGTGVAAMLILILGSMIIGWVMCGPERDKREILASTTGMRNVPICLLIALKLFPDRAVDIPILAFLLLVIPVNFLFTAFNIISNKKRTASAKHPAPDTS
jgi:hypothetical protein